MYTLRIERKVEKFIEKLIERERIEILNKLKILSDNPFQNSLDIKKLKGISGNTFRLRVKDYKILYEVVNNELLLVIFKA